MDARGAQIVVLPGGRPGGSDSGTSGSDGGRLTCVSMARPTRGSTTGSSQFRLAGGAPSGDPSWSNPSSIVRDETPERRRGSPRESSVTKLAGRHNVTDDSQGPSTGRGITSLTSRKGPRRGEA